MSPLRKAKSALVAAGPVVLLSACTTVQVWQLNDSIPHRLDSAERKRFDDRVQSFLRIHGVEGELKGWYTVNSDKFVVKVPCSLDEEFERRIPYIACNPDGDETACLRIE